MSRHVANLPQFVLTKNRKRKKTDLWINLYGTRIYRDLYDTQIYNDEWLLMFTVRFCNSQILQFLENFQFTFLVLYLMSFTVFVFALDLHPIPSRKMQKTEKKHFSDYFLFCFVFSTMSYSCGLNIQVM